MRRTNRRSYRDYEYDDSQACLLVAGLLLLLLSAGPIALVALFG